LDTLKRFKKEFNAWVRAYNRTYDYRTNPDELLSKLEKRIPDTTLRQIGGAFENGWLINESEQHRGYFVKESDRPGKRGGLPTITHVGNGIVNPWWELYVQLADYSRIRTVAEQHGKTVRLEDQLMDIVVYAGSSMILYVENKTDKIQAIKLLEGMREYGASGFQLDDPDKGNDSLRKAKYIVRETARPKFFALSAVDFEQIFQVDYLNQRNRFRINKKSLSLTEPLLEEYEYGQTQPRSVVDPLALDIDYLLGDKIWISPGSGKTAYNFYCPTKRGDAVVMGIYEDGRIWSDLRKLGKRMTANLSTQLAALGIDLDTSKSWTFWKRNEEILNLHNEDSFQIARQIKASIIID